MLKRFMGLNVVLAVLAYRDLLTFQPRMYSASTTLTGDAEQYLFAPAETAPLLILLLSLWLLYHRREVLFALPERAGPVWLAAIAIGLGSVIFAWAVYTRAPDIQALSLIANLVGCAILWRGLAAVRVAMLPLGLLLFAVPLPSPLIANWIWQFQLASAQLASWFLYLIGIPALVSAEVIQLPVDTYQVIETCSGLRSVQTLAMFSLLMSGLFDRGKLHALCLFASSLPIAFAMNGVRVTTLILNPHSQIHSIHVAQGLFVLMGGLVLVYALDGLLGRLQAQLQAQFQTQPPAPRPERHRVTATGTSGLRRAQAVSCVALLLLGTLYLLPAWQFRGLGGAHADAAFAEATRGWQVQELPGATNDLAKVSFRQSHRGRYARPGQQQHSSSQPLVAVDAPIEVFLGIGEHLDRFKTPFSPKVAFPGRGWVIEDVGQLKLDGSAAEITWRLLRSGTHRVVSYHWYEENRGLLEESLRSFFALDRSPFARQLPVMSVRMATEIEEVTPTELKRAHQRLAEFHSLVATAIDAIKEGLIGHRARDTASLLNFPL